MKFNVIGADRDTGEDIEMTLDAVDQSAAEEIAHKKGIMVARITPVPVQRSAVTQHVTRAVPMEQGHYRGAPVVNIATPRRGSSLGVASLILGILAFLICWIPFVNLLGVPLSGLGLLIGLIGLLVALTRKGASIGYPIAGTAICGLALFVAITVTGAFVGSLEAAGEEIVKAAERRNATNQTTGAAATNETSSQTSASDRRKLAKETASNPTAVAPAPPSEPEIEWASAENPVRQGEVQVRVQSARVDKVPLKDSFGDGTGESENVLLMIEIEVSNLSDTKKLNYSTWGATSMSFGNRTALTDNFENRYKAVHFGFGNEVVGAVESESLYPGDALKDVLVFEQPIAKVEYLNLELPAEEFGGEGMLRIRIPSSMIQR